MYGSTVTNALIQISQILRQATSSAPTTNNPVIELRLMPTPPPLSISSPSSSPVPVPIPLPETPAPSPTVPIPTVNNPFQSTFANLTHRYPNRLVTHIQDRRYVTRYGCTIYQVTQSVIDHMYGTHIAALFPSPPTAVKQAYLNKFLKVPDAAVWERSITNEWGHLLKHGVGK